MTIKQFLEKQPLDSDTILRFQFTDRYDVGWNHNTAKSSLKDRLIENFSCHLQRDEGEPGLYIFNLNLNKIPKNLFTTFFEIYEQPAHKSEGGNVTVREYLNELQKHYSKERQPRVFFRQKIFMKTFNEKDVHGQWRRFATQNAVSLEEAINGPFSHLFVDNVDAKDDTVFVDLVTTAEKRLEEMNMIIQQEEADKRLANAFNILGLSVTGFIMIVGTWLGWHFGGSILCSVFGLLCGLVGGLVFGLIVLDILKETGKFIVSEDGKLKFKRK